MSSAFTRRKFLSPARPRRPAPGCSPPAVAAAATPVPATRPPPRRSRRPTSTRPWTPQTTLTFWTWVPDITNQVKMFTTKYPKIKVNVVNVGQGAPHYQKLRTAIQSGQGAPDVAQMEYQYIPSFTLGDQGSLLDLTPYAPADIQSCTRSGCGARSRSTTACGGFRRTPGRWVCCTATTCSPLPGSRLRPPGTTSAPRPRRTTPRTRRAGWSTSRRTSPGQLVAYLWQAGVRPFSFDGQETVKVDLANDQAKKVVQVLGRPGHQRPGHQRRRLQRLLVPGPGQRQVGLAADRGLGTGVPPGHGRQDLGQVAGERPAAVGGRQDRVQQLGRLHRRRAEVEQEPDRRLAAGPVDQHQQGIDAPVRQRAVPVPADERQS